MSLSYLSDRHCTRIGSDLVVMDLLTDTYAVRLGSAPFDQLPFDAGLSAEEVHAASVGTDGQSGHVGVTLCTQRPRWRRASGERASLRLTHIRAFLRCYRHARLLWARHSIVELLQTFPPCASAEAELSYGDVASRFEQLALWCIGPDRCLFRTLALQLFLKEYGLFAQWVFGVRLYPFRAHSWCTNGDMLLGELPHRVQAYTPILIWPPSQ